MVCHIVYIGIPASLTARRSDIVAVAKERLEFLKEHGLGVRLAEIAHLMVKEQILTEPMAIFRGLCRPLAVPGDDAEWYDQSRVLVVVTRPKHILKDTGGSYTVEPVPSGFVLVAYMREIHDTAQRNQILQVVGHIGRCVYLLYWWEWVSADPGAPTLPTEYTERYESRLPWPQ